MSKLVDSFVAVQPKPARKRDKDGQPNRTDRRRQADVRRRDDRRELRLTMRESY